MRAPKILGLLLAVVVFTAALLFYALWEGLIYPPPEPPRVLANAEVTDESVAIWLALDTQPPKLDPEVEAHLRADLLKRVRALIGDSFPSAPTDLAHWFEAPADSCNAYDEIVAARRLPVDPSMGMSYVSPTQNELAVAKNYIEQTSAFRNAIEQASACDVVVPPLDLERADAGTYLRSVSNGLMHFNQVVRESSRYSALLATYASHSGNPEAGSEALVTGWQVITLAGQYPEILALLTNLASAGLLHEATCAYAMAAPVEAEAFKAIEGAMSRVDFLDVTTRTAVFSTVIGSEHSSGWLYQHALSAETQARIDALETVMAAIRYRQDKGSFPEELADLVPAYLEAIPKDPFIGDPLQYIVNDEGLWIGSVGPANVSAASASEDQTHMGRYGVYLELDEHGAPL